MEAMVKLNRRKIRKYNNCEVFISRLTRKRKRWQTHVSKYQQTKSTNKLTRNYFSDEMARGDRTENTHALYNNTSRTPQFDLCPESVTKNFGDDRTETFFAHDLPHVCVCFQPLEACIVERSFDFSCLFTHRQRIIRHPTVRSPTILVSRS